jgi:hypothetical protein
MYKYISYCSASQACPRSPLLSHPMETVADAEWLPPPSPPRVHRRAHALQHVPLLVLAAGALGVLFPRAWLPTTHPTRAMPFPLAQNPAAAFADDV